MSVTATAPRGLSLPAAVHELAWFALGSVVAFLVPYLGVSVLELQHDVYYLLYFGVTLSLLGAWAAVEHVDVAGAFRRQWHLSVGIGVAVAAFVVANVMSTDTTARPAGAYLAFEVLWRGVGYGIVDALLLTAFPCLIAYRILRGRIAGFGGRLRYTALALPLVLLITATYHLGYPQYREDGVSKPEIGNTLISIPAFATANPAGSLVAHVSMHVAAVLHSYETPTFLPPESSASSASGGMKRSSVSTRNVIASAAPITESTMMPKLGADSEKKSRVGGNASTKK